MFKIVYPTCCGIDVHKTFVIACIASTNEVGITSYQMKRFSTFTKGLRELSDWLNVNSCKDVCMESTGKYYIPVYNILETTCNCIVAHPKYVEAIRGKKTDKRDAKWIADLFKCDLIVNSFIPPLVIRQLRDLMRYRFKLTDFGSSEKNRFQNCLTVSNIQLASVVSDTFGKSSMAIIEKLLENPFNPIDIPSLIHGSMVTKTPELELAIDGVITAEQAEKIKIIKQHYEALELCKANLEPVILSLAEPYQKELEIISSLPSVNNVFTAIAIISEIGVDMSAFATAKHLCSWAGLTPTNNESADKKKSVRISRAGCYLKPLLVQCATAIVKSEKHPEIRNRYLNLRKRRGHKRAIIAIFRMLLTAIYHMLKKGELYNPELYKKAELLPISREITVEQAVFMIQRQGYLVTAAS
jgi:transposase